MLFPTSGPGARASSLNCHHRHTVPRMQDDLYALLDLDERYHLDLAELKRQFLARSRETHPDFHMQAAPEQQEQRLMENSLINNAFKTLSRPRERLAYLLKRYGKLDEGGQQTGEAALPQSFLMDMMELNERVEEAMDGAAQRQAVDAETAQMLADYEERISAAMTRFDAAAETDARSEVLDEVLRLHLERKYILRIRENLANFAGSA